MLTELLHQRRSIRKYLPDAPPQAWLEDVVDCGRTAPSPSNSQPVRIRRITSKAVRNQLQTALIRQRNLLLENLEVAGGPKRVRNYIKVYYRYSEFMFTAPWLLLVGTTRVAPGFGEQMSMAGLRSGGGDQRSDTDIAVGLFVSAMLLRATELGLGSCILTAPLVFLSPEKDLSAFTDLTPKCFLTLGYSAATPPEPERLPVARIMEEI